MDQNDYTHFRGLTTTTTVWCNGDQFRHALKVTLDQLDAERAEVAKLQEMVAALTERVAAQSELLGKRAEKAIPEA